MLIGFAVAAWGAGAGAQIANGQPPSSGLTFLAFVGSLIFAIYFAGAALWLTLYKPTHLCRISSWTTNSYEWNRHMPDAWSLEKAWVRDRRILNWLIVLAAIAAVCFLICAYATWTVAFNRSKFASYALYISCIGLILFGWIMIYWSEEAFEWHQFATNSRFSLFNVKFLKALGIAGIVIGLLAIIVRFIRNRTGLFILGMLSLILFILTICCAGLLLRNVWQARTDGNVDGQCMHNLAPIHEDDFAPRWCPSKYSTTGACTKPEMTLRWEETGSPAAALNQSCCKCVKEYYVWPFYILGIYSLLLALCAAVAAASLFYLSDNSDHYGVNKGNDGLDFAFLAIAILLVLAFGLYFLLRKENKIDNINNSYAAFNNHSAATDGDFEIVKDAVIANAAANAPSTDGFYAHDATANPLPAYNSAATECAGAAAGDCIVRAAILARNANIIPGDLAGATQGGANTRLEYFPGCTNNESGFVSFFGTYDEVTAAVGNVKYDITDLTTPTPEAFTYFDHVKRSDIKDDGVLMANNPSTTLSSDPDDSSCTTTANITAQTFTPTTTTIKGALYYFDSANPGVEQTATHAGVSVGAYRNNQLLQAGSVTDQGIYVINNIPVNPDSDYPLTVKISDADNVFNEDQIDVLIPSNAGSEVSSGRTQLTTKSGAVCASTDTACINNQTASTGNVNINVTNAETGAPISGVSVDLKQGSSVTGATTSTATTNNDGQATFTNVPYGTYTGLINDSNYAIADVQTVVQGSEANGYVALSPNDSENDISLSMDLGSEPADMDFKLYADNGSSQCEASPINKYCAYSQHFTDSTPDAPGTEIINIKDLSVAQYRTTVEPAGTYGGANCDAYAANNVDYNYHAFSIPNWNWFSFKTIRPLTKIAFNFKRRFGLAKTGGAGTSNAFSALSGLFSTPTPVETPFQASLPKNFVNQAGTALDTPVVGSTAIAQTPEEQALTANDPQDSFNPEEPVGPEEEAQAEAQGSEEPQNSEDISPSTAEIPNSQEDASTTDATPIDAEPVDNQRILQNGGNSANYLLVDCFTGFGKPSFVRANVYLTDLANLQDWSYCTNRVKPEYNLAALRTAQAAL
jgi:hypothetical protein